MFKIHVISDLNLGFNEHCSALEETMPDVDLVVIAGNIGHIKRSALYVETIAKKYPNIQFFWGWGEKERYFTTVEKFDGELEESQKFRMTHTNFPKNLHWTFNDRTFIKLQSGQEIDVFYAYGFPYILMHEGNWEDSYWFKNYIMHIQNDAYDFPYKPKETSNVNHGGVPIWASKEWVNAHYEFVQNKLRKWENEITGFKVLITHINQYNDTRLENTKFWPYRIHLSKMAWVTSNNNSGNVNFLGAHLLTNPGRGAECRGKVFEVDI